jgi:hypothetical protein
VSGTSLAALSGVSFATSAPFDAVELAAALLMLVLAIVAFVLTRFLSEALPPTTSVLRVAFVSLLIVSALTAAHSVQVI